MTAPQGTDVVVEYSDPALARMAENAPVCQSYSKEQMVSRAKEYMRITFTKPRDLEPEQRDRYYERLGLLLMYVDHLWKPFGE